MPQATRKPRAPTKRVPKSASSPAIDASAAAPRSAATAVATPRWWPKRWPLAWYERARAFALLTRQDKPIGWLLLLWPALWGLWLAADGVPPLGVLAIFVAGVIVTRSLGCIANDWSDRWLDTRVERTRARPLASGLVSAREAAIVFSVLLALALGLALLTNARTVILAAVALGLAVIYPFMKRITWWPQFWLGLAFGMSIPMAATAVTGEWPGQLIWLAFAANLLWVIAYDTFYAMVDRDDDLKAGAKSTAILFGDLDLVATGVLLASFLGAMALLGQRAGFGFAYWLGLAAAAGIAAWTLWLARGRDRDGCFRAFRMSHYAGAAVFVGLALDRALAQ